MSNENAAIKMLGKTIGGCEIKRLLGTGGMGAVFLADQLNLDKEVAVKILDERWAARPEHVEGFLREARLAAKLEDEHVVQIYDVGTDAGKNFIIMQLARGESLKDRIKRGPLDIDEAMNYIEGVARGLAAAHVHNIVHRDIKPGNLIIGESGDIKILDFGLARLEDKENDKTRGQFMGSIAYMAPEQSEYMPTETPADIYSLGITAYHCLTGTLPFRGENNFDLIVKHHTELPPAPSVVRHDVPLTLSRVVLRMIEKDPRKRYANINDLLLDMKLIRRHQLPVSPSIWEKRPLDPRRIDLTGIESKLIYSDALRTQRDEFTAGKPVTPLRKLLLDGEIKFKNSDRLEMRPSEFLEVSDDEHRLSLKDAAATDFAPAHGKYLEYADRYRVFVHEDRLVLRVVGQKPVGRGDVQRLFDFLEAVPGKIKHLAVAVEADYVAQGSDIRWIVDAYNILDKRGMGFALIVGSMENHSTFVNLGIDSHIKLELELERTGSVSRARVAEVVSEAEPVALTASSQAMVNQVRDQLDAGELLGAARTWRRLVIEGLEKSQVASLKDLQDSLFKKLLAEGKEAYDADDTEAATECFNLLIDLDAGRHEGHYYKGLLLKSEGKLEYAQAFLTQAILAAPDEAELFYHRAIVRSRVDDMEGALRDLDMALQHNPRFVKAYYNRAKLHKRMGREDLSKRDLGMYERLKGKGKGAGASQPITPPAPEGAKDSV
ncbi:MAG: protein kinase domain-containing protein [Planctomycetota bacterium]|jgi:serine/threonine protein kinase